MLDAEVTRSTRVIDMDDFKPMMIITLVAVTLLVLSRKPASPDRVILGAR